MKLILYTLLFSLSIVAQKAKSEFQKKIDTVNIVLQQSENISFVGQDEKTTILKKIDLNKGGTLFSVTDSIYGNKESRSPILNLSAVKRFIIVANEIQLMDQNGKKIAAIIYVSQKYLYSFNKDLNALLFICQLYAKQDPRFKCE